MLVGIAANLPLGIIAWLSTKLTKEALELGARLLLVANAAARWALKRCCRCGRCFYCHAVWWMVVGGAERSNPIQDASHLSLASLRLRAACPSVPRLALAGSTSHIDIRLAWSSLLLLFRTDIFRSVPSLRLVSSWLGRRGGRKDSSMSDGGENVKCCSTSDPPNTTSRRNVNGGNEDSRH